MRVIDVDSHFLEPVDWLARVSPALAAEIPPCDPIERIVQGVVGDLLEVVPRSQRPANLLDLLAPSGRRHLEAMLAMNAAARLRFCDEHGIDVQFLNPTLGIGPFAAATKAGRPDLARRSLEAFNTW